MTGFQEMVMLFFEDPSEYFMPPRSYSELYLLRRDVDFCFGINNVNRNGELERLRNGDELKGNIQENKALFIGAMGILAGIDLLGKFLVGTDNHRKVPVGERFRQFLQRYFYLENSFEDAHVHEEVLYQFRNALLHSFGLYSVDFNKGIIYEFTATSDNSPLIQQTRCYMHRRQIEEDGELFQPCMYQIDLYTLYRKFEEAIVRYRCDLEKDQQLQDNFKRMFRFYGTIDIENNSR